MGGPAILFPIRIEFDRAATYTLLHLQAFAPAQPSSPLTPTPLALSSAGPPHMMGHPMHTSPMVRPPMQGYPSMPVPLHPHMMPHGPWTHSMGE